MNTMVDEMDFVRRIEAGEKVEARDTFQQKRHLRKRNRSEVREAFCRDMEEELRQFGLAMPEWKREGSPGRRESG